MFLGIPKQYLRKVYKGFYIELILKNYFLHFIASIEEVIEIYTHMIEVKQTTQKIKAHLDILN